jgi:hypothetical protein
MRPERVTEEYHDPCLAQTDSRYDEAHQRESGPGPENGAPHPRAGARNHCGITRQQEQITLLERELSLQQEQMTQFAEQVQALHERLAKDSHKSHLPPSSDRFSRQPKSLRKKSGKKPGGQEGHPGKTLLFSPCPDEVLVHLVERLSSARRT